MSVTGLAQLWLVILLCTGKESQANGANRPRQLVNADIISLEEYGIVFKPGRLMWTSDFTHIYSRDSQSTSLTGENDQTPTRLQTICASKS